MLIKANPERSMLDALADELADEAHCIADVNE
jgi:hypothetical protein